MVHDMSCVIDTKKTGLGSIYRSTGVSMKGPDIAVVNHNDWSQIPHLFDPYTPRDKVSIVIPYYQNKKALDATIQSLQYQTYPKELTEIIVVDDGTDPPLTADDVPFGIRVVSQKHDGFGAARAKNHGACVASGDILVFVDADMVLDQDAITIHAGCHHVASNLYVTLCNLWYIDESKIINWETLVHDLFNYVYYSSLNHADWISDFLKSNNYLTNGNDDIWTTLPGPNFSIRRDSYFEIGGFLLDYKYWGLEDTHIAYRAYVHGLILVPIINTCAYHLGIPTNKEYRINAAMIEKHIAHRGFRDINQNIIFVVPEYVISIKASNLHVILSSVFNIFYGHIKDFVIRIDTSNFTNDDILYLEQRISNDPRVVIGPLDKDINDFPDSFFYINVITNTVLKVNFIKQLRSILGNQDCILAQNQDCDIRITRAWLMHRAKKHNDYYAMIDNSKIVSASQLVTNKKRNIDTPIERALPNRYNRILHRLKYISSTENKRNAIKWLYGRIIYYSFGRNT